LGFVARSLGSLPGCCGRLLWHLDTATLGLPKRPFKLGVRQAPSAPRAWGRSSLRLG
jgi:hypothetical protein